MPSEILSLVSKELQVWWKELRERGIVPDNTLRVIIDIDWTGKKLPLIYYQTFVDPRMINEDLLSVLQKGESVSADGEHNEDA